MSQTVLAGVLPVISTPFDVDDEIDESALAREIGWLLDCGVHGVTIAMVSEVLRLSDVERRRLCTLVVDAVGGRVPVVSSVGAESTKAATSLARHAEQVGAAAVMAVPPVAVSLPEAALLGYFCAIVDAVALPVVVQDASGYLGRPLSLELYLNLLDRYGPDRVLFKPEATPIGPRLSRLRDASGGTARVFEGTGGLALVDSHRRGIVGTMPGPELAWAVLALWDALQAGDQATVDAVHPALAAMIALQTSLDDFIAVEKHLLVRQGILDNDRRRLPHGDTLDAETATEIDRLVDVLRRVLPTQSPS